MVLVAKESAENVSDVGVIWTEAVTVGGGKWSTCAIDDGRGTMVVDSLSVSVWYVILKTDGLDSSDTCSPGPWGEVSFSSVVAVWSISISCVVGYEFV